MHKKAWRNRSGLSYFGEALNNEAKSIGYGIKPIQNAVSGITFGLIPRANYGYNPNDKYLSSGMIKTRSALRGIGEGALSLAAPAGVLRAGSKIMRSVPLLNKGRIAYNKWLRSPLVGKGVLGHTVNPVLKSVARIGRMGNNEYRAFMNMKLGGKNNPFFKTMYRKLMPTDTIGTKNLSNAEWTKMLSAIKAGTHTVGGQKRGLLGKAMAAISPGLVVYGIGSRPFEGYQQNNVLSAVDTGNFSSDQMNKLKVNPEAMNYLQQWAHQNNKPWYEHDIVKLSGITRDNIIDKL